MLELEEGWREGEGKSGAQVWEPCREEHTGQAGPTSFSLLISDLKTDQELSNPGGGKDSLHQAAC